MQPAPFCVALLILAKHHAKSHASAPIALVTQLMEADQFRFPCILRTRRRQRATDNHSREARDCNR
jgi:hypothetical protein